MGSPMFRTDGCYDSGSEIAIWHGCAAGKSDMLGAIKKIARCLNILHGRHKPRQCSSCSASD